jgi:ribosomal protein S18 acetylase RimI-like enzyme
VTSKHRIEAAQSDEDLRSVAALFADYAAWLPIDLGYQDFEAELAGLPGKYAPPQGALLIARDVGGGVIGCVGLRALDEPGVCEMKRLYLKPQARGTGLGKALAEAIVEAARERGYTEMRLDTLESMNGAIGLYERMGFVRIAPYYSPTPEGTVFMGLRL